MDGISTSEIEARKKCSLCGSDFGCGAKSGECWCAVETLDAAVTVRLAELFGDCLCPACLRTASAGPSMIFRYADGKAEIVGGAVRVDTQNFHEGMFDLYDKRGNLLKQIPMGVGISWETIGG